MNREIKFRAKSVETGEWLIGYYVQLAGFDYIVPFNSAFRDILDADYENAFEEVDVKTLQQWAELKDIHDKDIYEGDIILFTWFAYNGGYEVEKETTHKGSIEFIDGSFMFCAEHGTHPFSNLDFNSEMDIEIIGNIHDNPELLTNN